MKPYQKIDKPKLKKGEGRIKPLLKIRLDKARQQIKHFTKEVQDPYNPNIKMSWALLVFWIKRLDEYCQEIPVSNGS